MTGRKKSVKRMKSGGRQKTGSRSLPILRAPRQVQEKRFDGELFFRVLDDSVREVALAEASRWRREGQLARVTQNPCGDKFTVWLKTPDQETKKRLGRTMFVPARDPVLAAVVRIDSPHTARAATKQLKKMHHEASTSKRKTQIKRAAVLAANRAAAFEKRKGISPKERKEMSEVVRIYRDAVKEM